MPRAGVLMTRSQVGVRLRVHHQPQVAGGVLDLGALVEAAAGDQHVRHPRSGGSVSSSTRLWALVRKKTAISSKSVMPSVAQLVDQRGPPPAPRRARRGPTHQRQRLALGARAPQLLRHAAAVAGDDRVRRLEDGLVRAVVLLELHHLAALVRRRGSRGCCPRRRRATGRCSGRRRPPPPRSSRRRREQLQQLVLHRVGVLELVDQHVGEAALVVQPHAPRGRARARTSKQQQVAEVHRVGRAQQLLVLRGRRAGSIWLRTSSGRRRHLRRAGGRRSSRRRCGESSVARGDADDTSTPASRMARFTTWS